MPQTKSPKTCWFEVCDIPLENFRLPKDGRKWKAAAGARQHLFMHLAKFANKDGTSARPSIPTLMKRTGFSHGKTCYILDDLKTLGFWEKAGRNGWNGTTIRTLKVPIVGVQDSEEGVQDSGVGVQPRVDATCPLYLSSESVYENECESEGLGFGTRLETASSNSLLDTLNRESQNLGRMKVGLR